MKDFIKDNKFLFFLLLCFFSCLLFDICNTFIVNSYIVYDVYERYFYSIDDYRIYKLEEVNNGRID